MTPSEIGGGAYEWETGNVIVERFATDRLSIEKMAQMCGASVPERFAAELRASSDPAKTGVDFAIAQCRELKARGVKGFHFYPLNKAKAVAAVLDAIL